MIASSTRDGIATVTLDRPEARNALPNAGWHALADTFATVAASDARVLILRSAAPGIFCAGADLAELARLADHPEERAPFRHAMRAAIDALAALPMPSIAAIDGGCFGVALALALAADLRVADATARFAITPARLGIVFPAEDVARLTARVGHGQAARLLFTAAAIDAAEAHRIGLADLLDVDVDDLATAIAANHPASVRQLKRVLADPDDPAHAIAFDAAFGTTGFVQGLAEFNARPR